MIEFSSVRFWDFPSAMTVQDVAKYFGVCVKPVYIMIQRDDITAAKIGKEYIISKDLLKGYCKKNKR